MILKDVDGEHFRDKGRGGDRELDGASGQGGVTPQVGGKEQVGDMDLLGADVEVFGGDREALGRGSSCHVS
jgi:hypothetical protein